MDEIYQKIEQSDYDYLWITDPYIVKVIQNINEKFPPLYPITDKDILEERLVKCGFYDLNLKSASEDWMRWVKTEIFMYFKKEKKEVNKMRKEVLTNKEYKKFLTRICINLVYIETRTLNITFRFHKPKRRWRLL